MEYCKSKLLWVDQGCIDQYDEVEKQVAVESMDLVYGLRKFPVALLYTSIKSKEHLRPFGKAPEGTNCSDRQVHGIAFR